MKSSNDIALKEWAVVCNAMASGVQRVLFRTGGIHEGPEGFRPEHQEFWLFPTGFHQTAEGVRQEYAAEAERVLKSPPPAGVIPIQHYATIAAVHWIEKVEQLPLLRPFHILSDEAVLARFHYRKPGLFLLVVDVQSLPEPVNVPNDSRYDGCRSWVTLNQAIATGSLQRTASDAKAADEIAELLS